jgi:hypothetical protein
MVMDEHGRSVPVNPMAQSWQQFQGNDHIWNWRWLTDGGFPRSKEDVENARRPSAKLVGKSS